MQRPPVSSPSTPSTSSPPRSTSSPPSPSPSDSLLLLHRDLPDVPMSTLLPHADWPSTTTAATAGTPTLPIPPTADRPNADPSAIPGVVTVASPPPPPTPPILPQTVPPASNLPPQPPPPASALGATPLLQPAASPRHPRASPGVTRPPRAPPKRARSDELHPVHRTLRPSDRVRVLAHRKPERDRLFTSLYRWQRVRAHAGAVRALDFCASGRWLASAGADALVKLWDVDVALDDTRPAALAAADASHDGKGASASHASVHGADNPVAPARLTSAFHYIRNGAPALTLQGHTADVTALSWSKNDFLLSASADRTIRLWHPRAKACLRRLVHSDVVTSVAFHPTDEQICIAAAADGLVRMWHLKERKLLSTADTDDVVTACAITPDGTTALVGTRAGRCKFFGLFDEIVAEWQFKHTTQLDVRSRRARHAQGKKICGFRFYAKSDKVLVSTNDSRLRLFRLDDKSVVAKFVGHANTTARYNGSFDPYGRFVLCASEARAVHIWELDVPLRDFAPPFGSAASHSAAGPTPSSQAAAAAAAAEAAAEAAVAEAAGHGATAAASSASIAGAQNVAQPAASAASRKDVGVANESFIVQDAGMVTAAVFAPSVVPPAAMNLRAAYTNARTSGLVIVTASDDGDIRVFGCC